MQLLGIFDNRNVPCPYRWQWWEDCRFKSQCAPPLPPFPHSSRHVNCNQLLCVCMWWQMKLFLYLSSSVKNQCLIQAVSTQCDWGQQFPEDALRCQRESIWLRFHAPGSFQWQWHNAKFDRSPPEHLEDVDMFVNLLSPQCQFSMEFIEENRVDPFVAHVRVCRVFAAPSDCSSFPGRSC